MTRSITSVADAKAEAHRRSENVPSGTGRGDLSRCYEDLAHENGFRDWNAFAAHLKALPEKKGALYDELSFASMDGETIARAIVDLVRDPDEYRAGLWASRRDVMISSIMPAMVDYWRQTKKVPEAKDVVSVLQLENPVEDARISCLGLFRWCESTIPDHRSTQVLRSYINSIPCASLERARKGEDQHFKTQEMHGLLRMQIDMKLMREIERAEKAPVA